MGRRFELNLSCSLRMKGSEIISHVVPSEDSFSDDLKKANDIIILNVGGTRFEALKSNFAYWPTTRLSRLIRATTEEDILSLCDGFCAASVCPGSVEKDEYYFHRDWSNFNSILGLYRNTRLHATIPVCCTHFDGDLKYWGIDELLLDPCCALRHYPQMEQIKKEVAKELKIKRKEKDRMLYENFGNSWIAKSRQFIWNLTELKEPLLYSRVMRLHITYYLFSSIKK